MKHAIIYQGPSLIDGKAIVVIATYSNSNTKTGTMVQTYIMRSDIAPTLASKIGADYSICGDCPLRGTPTDDPARKQAAGRKCYVNLGQGPTVVYRAFKRGVYKAGSPESMGHNRMVRIGTYGDPAAVPIIVWRKLVARSLGWTGYTHQWRDNPELSELIMASVESVYGMNEANESGWRTFRIMQKNERTRHIEVNCPASKEAGARTQCADCLLCMGNTSKSPKSISIYQH